MVPGRILLDAGYQRHGADLVLVAKDGNQVVIRGFFDAENAPTLTDESGASIAPDLAAALAKALGPALYAQAQPGAVTADAIGRVEKLQGDVLAARPDGGRRKLEIGDSVYQGEVIETGAGGAVGIVFADRSTFALNENARMLLDRLIYDPGVKRGALNLSVLKGAFLFVSGEVAKMQGDIQLAGGNDQESVSIRTPVATIGVRGTAGGGNALGEGLPNTFTVFDGRIIVKTDGGELVLDGPLQTTTVFSFLLSPTAPRLFSRTDALTTFGSAIGILPLSPPSGADGQHTTDGTTARHDGSSIIQTAIAAATEPAAGSQGSPQGDTQTAFTTPPGGDASGQSGSAMTQFPSSIGPTAPPSSSEISFITSPSPTQAGPSSSPNGGPGPLTDDLPSTPVQENSPPPLPAVTTIVGTPGNDTLIGTNGPDFIQGLAGNDIVKAGAGDDELFGGEGNDTLDGEAGNDLIHGAADGGGNDVLIGGAGNDTVSYISSTAGVTVDLATGIATGNETVGTDTLSGFEAVKGSNFADVIRGDDGPNVLSGAAGNDQIEGRGGNDILLGEEGDDTLTGGAGNDALVGGSGNDDVAVFSGKAIDYRVVVGNNNVVTVEDLRSIVGNDGTDTLQGVERLKFSDLDILAVGNSAPNAQPDSISKPQGLLAKITVADLLANDSDANADSLTIIKVGEAQHGSVSLSGNDIFFTPEIGYVGPASFTYTVADGKGGVSVATANIELINTSPTAQGEAFDTAEDTALTIPTASLLSNDSDPDPGTTLSITKANNASHGSVSLNGTNVVFTPEADFNGTAGFDYIVSDGQGGTATAHVSVSVSAVNDAPVATPDSASASENGLTTITAASLLANDSDVDTGDTRALLSVSATSAAGASVSLVGGNVVYDPGTHFDGLRAGQTGTDSFTYTIQDAGGLTATATVTLSIIGANDAPVAHDDVNVTSVSEDGPAVTLASATLLANDTDVDLGDTKIIVAVSGAAPGASVALVSGNIVYDPGTAFQSLKAGESPTDHFTYTMQDGAGAQATATASLTIVGANDAPVAHDDLAVASVSEDGPAVTIAGATLLANDTDVDAGDTKTLVSVSGTTPGTSVAVVGGAIVYDPGTAFQSLKAGESTSDHVVYTMKDAAGATASATVTLTVTGVNDAPVADNETYTLAEDTPLAVAAGTGVLVGDTDVDGDALTAVLASGPAHAASFALNAGGSFSYTPEANFHGTDSFTYRANDGTTQGNLATVTLTITPVNDAPVAGTDTLSTAEDTAATIGAASLLANDTDVDGDTLSVTAVGNAAHGSVSLNGGNIIFTPDADYNGPAGFEYTVSDGNGGTATGHVDLTVTPVNDAPVANDDAHSTAEDTALTITAASLLGNDSDVDGDTLSVTGVSNASHGSVSLNGTTIVFTPDADYNGPAGFDYAISDGQGGTATAHVDVTVTPVNDAPVAQNDTAGPTNEDTALTLSAASLLSNDSDVDGDTLSLTAVSNAVHGSVQLVGSNVVFTPDTNYNGPVGFDYTVSDGHGGTATGHVDLTVTPVNDAPIAQNDTVGPTAEDTALTISAASLLSNDSDVDSDALSLAAVSNAVHGSVSLNGANIVFTPGADYNGPASFDYTVSDGNGGTAIGHVDLSVTPVNDAPVPANDSHATDEDTPLTLTAASLVSNDTDVDGDTLSITSVKNASHGTVALVGGNVVFTPDADYNGPAGFDYTVSDGNGGTASGHVDVTVNSVNDAPIAIDDAASTSEDTAVTIAAADLLNNDTDVDGDTLSVTAAGNAAHGSVQLVGGNVVFTPDADYNGPAGFDYTVSDGNGGATTGHVTITIDPVNDAPVAVPDSASTAEDTAITLATASLLGNDSDVDGDTLSITAVSNAAHGSVQLVGSDVVFTPDADYNGPASFDYTVSDSHGGTATGHVDLTVTPVNDAPVAQNDTVGPTAEDTALTISAATLLANDSDVDGDTLSITAVGNAVHGSVSLNGGNIVFTPGTDYNGPASFDYTVSDGHGGTATGHVDLTVTPVNDAPVAQNDIAGPTNEDTALTINTATLLFNDSDVEGDTLSIAAVSNASHGTVVLNGSDVVFTPDADYNGPAGFDYTVSDGQGGTAAGHVNVAVAPVNDAPVAQDDTVGPTNEDTALTITAASLLSNDSDVDGDALGITAVGNASGGSVALVGGNIVFTPAPDFNGAAGFDYTVSDGNGGTDVAHVDLTVNPVNDPPIAVDDAVNTDEDVALTIAGSTLTANDTDVDSGSLTVASVGNASHGTVSLVDGSVVFTPDADYHGAAGFDYTVSDGNGGTDVGHVDISVASVNDAPIAENDSGFSTPTDKARTIAAAELLANDSDVDGDALSVVSVAPVSGGTVSLAGNNIVFVADEGYVGPASFTYTVSDGHGGEATASVAITIRPGNSPPVAVDDAATVGEDGATTISSASLLQNDFDLDADEGDTISLIAVSSSTPGVTVSLVNGNVVYDPGSAFQSVAAGQTATDTITYTIRDTAGATATGTVTLTVTGANDTPVAAGDVVTTAEDTALTIAASTLVSNDSDIDQDTLTIASVANATHGTASMVGGNVVFTPDADYNGPAGFDYTIADGHGGTATAHVSVTVDPVNDAPVAQADTATTAEDTSVTIAAATLLGNDSDVEHDALSLTSVSNAAHGSVQVAGSNVIFTPDADYNGPASFDYTISDGNGGTATGHVDLTVTPVNDAPVSQNDTVGPTAEDTALTISAASLLANDSDVDGDSLSITAVGNESHGNVSLNGGNIVFTPGTDYNGPASFDYTVSDGHGGTAIGHVDLSVTPVNDAPVAQNDSAGSTAEDTALTIAAADLLANDSDVEGDTLTIVSVGNASNGSAQLVGANIIFTPGADYHGPAGFDYTVSDGNGGTATAHVALTVTPVNDAPVALGDAVSTNEDTATTIAASTLLSNDTDVDGDTLSVTAVSNAAHGSVSLVGNNVVFTPDQNFNGAAGFDYTVSDGQGGTATGHVTVTINPVNDAPVAADDAASTAEDTAMTIATADLSANDTDVDGDGLTVTAVGNASHGSVSLNGTNVVFTPDADFNGTAGFDYTVADGQGGTATAHVSVSVSAVNDAPIANPDSANAGENGLTTLAAATLLANDSDVDAGDTRTILSVSSTSAAGAAVSVDGSGNIVYDPGPHFDGLRAGQTGTDSFTYTIQDAGGLTSTATVTLSIIGANDAPEAHDDLNVASVGEDGPATTLAGATLLANDSDVDLGDTQTIVAVSGGAPGSSVSLVNGNIVYDPGTAFQSLKAGESGSDHFVYTMQDGSGAPASATASLTIVGANDGPVAHDDLNVTSVSEDGPAVTVAGATLLANDTDVDAGDTKTLLSVSGATPGTSVALVGGAIVYDPGTAFQSLKAGESTSDHFVYTMKDAAGATSSATVTLTVMGVNDAPVADDESYSTNEDTPLTVATGAGVVAGDTDVDGDALTAVLASGPAHAASFTLNADGSFSYTPEANFHGTDSFTYRASDGTTTGNLATVTLTITPVNDAPVAGADTLSTAEDTAVTIGAASLLGNDTDVDGDTLSLTAVGNAAHGSVSLNAGTVVFTPDADYNGPASFDYTVSDGQGGTATGHVSVTVDPVNDAPVAQADAAATAEDTALTISAASLLGNDSDVDGDTLSVTSVSNAAHGSVQLIGTNIVFTPDADYNGPAGFDYTVSDGQGGTANAHVAVTVTPVNDAPVAQNDTVGPTAEDAALTISAASLLTNDTDVDGDTLSLATVSNAAHGSVQLNGGNVIFTSDADYNGPASFDYTVSDENGGTATAHVDLTVTPVNDAPVAQNDSVGPTNEDTALTISAATLLANDSDVDGDGLSLTAVGNAAHGTVSLNGANIVFTPAADYNGAASFDYTVSDGQGGTATGHVALSVTPVNDAPVSADDARTTDEDTPLTMTAASLLSNDTDVDGDALSLTSVDNASHGTVALIGGNVVFTPDADYNGNASFDYTVSDGQGGTDVGHVDLTVTPVNDAPVAGNDTLSTNEDTAVTVAATTLLGNDTDVDGDTLSVTAVSNPAHGSVQLVGNNVVFMPGADYNGPASFDYTVSDGHGGTATGHVDVTVNAVNDSPVATTDAASTNEDTALTIAAATLLGNDTDVDGDTLTLTAVSSPVNGTVALNGSNVVFTPDANYNGPASFDYTVADGQGGTATGHVNVTVNPVNDTPVALTDTVGPTAEDTALTIAAATLASNDTDVDGDALTVTAVNNPTNGTVTLNAGNVVFTPGSNYNGPAGFDYTVSDGHGGTSVGHVDLTVTPVNDPPVAVADSASTAEDTAATISAASLLGNDTDIDGDTLSVIAVSNAAHGSVQLVGSDIVFTPDQNFNGTAGFDYTASDGHGGTSVGHVTVTVTPVNDAPVAQDDTASTAEDTAVTIATSTLRSNDTDVDGDTLTVAAVSNPSHGAVSLNGANVVFTPDADFNGTAGFDYSIADGHGGTAVGHVTVNVTPVNDAPVAVNDLNVATVSEDGPAATIAGATLLANDTDVDTGDTRTLLSVSGTSASGASVVLNGGNVIYTPGNTFQSLKQGDSVSDSFTYTMKDSAGAQSTATVTLTIQGTNDAPVAVADGTFPVTFNTATTIAAATLLANDSDIDAGDTLQVTAVGSPSHGTVSLIGGNVIFTPDTGYTGPASFQYTLSDGFGGTATGSVALDVAPNLPTISGTEGNDTLVGTGVAEIILGLGGDDALTGGAGNDTLNGGSGIDVAAYDTASGGVSVNLESGAATDGTGSTDTLTGIESATGSAYDDTIVGSSGPNALSGNDGSDVIDGAAGNDTLAGGGGFDLLKGGAGDDSYVFDTNGGGYADVVRDVGGGETNGDILQFANTRFGPTDFTVQIIDNNLEISNSDSAKVQDLGDLVRLVVDDFTGAGKIERLGIDALPGTIYTAAAAGTAGNDVIVDGDTGTSITGLGGDDLVWANGGNDTINGGAGNDILIGGAGNDIVAGGDDNDTLVGGEGDDTLTGDLGNDVLYGDNGVNQLQGGAGNDTYRITRKSVSAIDPVDTITESGGTDTLYFENGFDFIQLRRSNATDVLLQTSDFTQVSIINQFGAGANPVEIFVDGLTGKVYTVGSSTGTAGNDFLFGTFPGSGTFSGGAGDDVMANFAGVSASLDGGAGNDILYSSTKAETLAGGADFDIVSYRAIANSSVTVNLATGTASGGGGADKLSGFEGVIGTDSTDTLIGSGAAEYFRGAGEKDLITGGGGNDTYAFWVGDGNDTITAGAGIDTVSFNSSILGTINPGDVAALKSGNHLRFDHLDDRVTVLNHFTVNGVEKIVFDSPAATTFTLLTGVAVGTSGNDFIVLGSSQAAFESDTVHGLAGHDYIAGNGGNDTLWGDDGNDALRGDSDNDTLFGGTGDDHLLGGIGNDRLVGEDGADTLVGGLGDDALLGGTGDDVYRFEAGFGTDTITEGGGTDVIVLDGNTIQDFTALRSGNDLVLGMMDGTNSSILVTGHFTPGATADGRIEVLVDANGNGFFVRQDLIGDIESDLIAGTNASETLDGNDGDDFLSGGGGNDTLLGGAGSDFLIGGAGNDFIDGGSGFDIVSFRDATAGITATIVAGSAMVADGQGGTDTLSNIEGLIGSTSADRLTAGTASAYLRGLGGNDTLTGNNGNDTLIGDDGNDTLFGNIGNDTLTGGTGNDTLRGGAGADTLTGGGDADRFQYFDPTDGHVVATNTLVTAGNFDVITDFESGNGQLPPADQIQINAANFTFSAAGMTFTDGVNFSVIDTAYDGTFDNSSVPANSEWLAGHSSLIVDTANGASRLIYDGNGAGAGYTILAQVQGGSVQATDVTTN